MTAKERGRRVVVGFDGSASAREAVDRAAAEAGPDGTVYVVYAYGPPSDWLGHPNYDRVLDEHQNRGRAVLDGLAMGDDALLETNFEMELMEGPPAEAIASCAETRDADLIVVGSRGLGAVRGALAGSVTQRLVHVANRPLLVMPRNAT